MFELFRIASVQAHRPIESTYRLGLVWNVPDVPAFNEGDSGITVGVIFWDLLMISQRPRSLASVGGHPLHVMLVSFPIVCFIGTFASDIAYWQSANMMWANFSAWLLTVGLIISVFAVLAGLIDFLGSRQIRSLRAAWVHAIGNVIVIILSIVNAFVHSRDAYTSVVPTGIILSGIVVLILAVTGWNGWTMVYRHGVAVLAGDDR